MKSTRTHSQRTAAFVGAMLIAFAGVTGTFATSGLNDTLVASADWYDDSYEGSAYAENLANAYREFFNLKNENDKITVYTMRVGTDGTFKNGTQEARFTLTGSQNVGGIDVDALLESENFDPSNEILIAVRSINGGSYDYFSFENVYTCVYLGRNPFIFDEWEKNGKPDMIDANFGLNSYTVGENKSYDKAFVYSTMLDDEGEKTAVVTLTGKNDITLSIPYDDRYGYTAMEVNAEVGTSPTSGMTTYFMWNNEANKWSIIDATGKLTATINPLPLFVNDAHFPMLADYNVQEVRIYKNGEVIQTIDKKTYDNGWGAVTQYFEKADGTTAAGLCWGRDYEQYSWQADVAGEYQFGKASRNINGIIGGKFLANIPYATNLTSFSEAYTETIPEIVGDGNGSDVYAYEEIVLGEGVSIQNFAKETAIDEYHSDWRDTPVILGEGAYEERVRPVAVDSASGNWIETSNHGNVYLLKEVQNEEEKITAYSAGDFDFASFTIPDYDSNAEYFLKIAANKSEKDFVYYRWDENAGEWKFRTSTFKMESGDNKIQTVPVTIAELPYYTKYGIMTISTEKNGVRTERQTWDIGDFEAGNITLDVDASGDETTYVTFNYIDVFNGDTWEETIEYKYVGIDPILNSHVFFNEKYYNPVLPAIEEEAIPLPSSMRRPVFLMPTNAEADDVITVDGETADGNEVHYELTQEWNLDTIKIPEGEYTVTNQTSGIKEEVVIDAEETADGDIVKGEQARTYTFRKPMNLKTPVSANHFSLSAPDGTEIKEGTLPNGVINDFDDIGLSGNQLKKYGTYVAFESESGIVNSANDNDYTAEKGYLVVTNGKLEKVFPTSDVNGDVNSDGVLSVLDLVAQQRYLHNTATYQAENFINGDFNHDGNVDIFDLALMKRTLLQ